jgi:hypothetical protein
VARFCLGFGAQALHHGFLKNWEVVLTEESLFFSSSGRKSSQIVIDTPHPVSQPQWKKIKAVMTTRHVLDQEKNAQCGGGYTGWCPLTTADRNAFYFIPLSLLYDVVLRHTH